MVVVGTGGIGSKYLKEKWPIEEGLTAGTTKLREKWQLEAEESAVMQSVDGAGWGSL